MRRTGASTCSGGDGCCDSVWCADRPPGASSSRGSDPGQRDFDSVRGRRREPGSKVFTPRVRITWMSGWKGRVRTTPWCVAGRAVPSSGPWRELHLLRCGLPQPKAPGVWSVVLLVEPDKISNSRPSLMVMVTPTGPELRIAGSADVRPDRLEFGEVELGSPGLPGPRPSPSPNTSRSRSTCRSPRARRIQGRRLESRASRPRAGRDVPSRRPVRSQRLGERTGKVLVEDGNLDVSEVVDLRARVVAPVVGVEVRPTPFLGDLASAPRRRSAPSPSSTSATRRSCSTRSPPRR